MATEQQSVMAALNVTVKKRKGGKGRQKIEIKKISQFRNRQVSFSKRKKNLFKKAKAFSIDCKARIAVFALSENGRPHEFGNPDVETLIGQFLATTTNNDGNTPMPVSITSGDLVNYMGSLEELEKYMESLLEMRAKVETKNIDENTMAMDVSACPPEITAPVKIVTAYGDDLIGFDNFDWVNDEMLLGFDNFDWENDDMFLGFDDADLLVDEAEGNLGNINTSVTCNDYHGWEDKGSFDDDQQWSYLPPFCAEGISGNFNMATGDYDDLLDDEAEGNLGNINNTITCNDYHGWEDKGSFYVDQQWCYLPPFCVEGISGNLNMSAGDYGDLLVDEAEGNLGNINTDNTTDYHSWEDKASFGIDKQWNYLPPLDECISGNLDMVATGDDHQWPSYLEDFGHDNAVEGLWGDINVPRVDNQWSYLAADWTNGYASVLQS